MLLALFVPFSASSTAVFYNAFVSNEGNFDRVRAIAAEQWAQLDPRKHTPRTVVSIGVPLQLPLANKTVFLKSGSEGNSLFLLWKHCKRHPTKTVMYLHSKGSYHSKPSNEQLRKYATYAASSPECTNMPIHCNVCGARMVPYPYPQVFGNMWTAKCSYVQHLVDPLAIGPTLISSNYPTWCTGKDRYAFEYWVLTHPAAKPCDVSPDTRYVKSDENIPVQGTPFLLAMAPRVLDVAAYRKPFQWMWFWNKCPSLKSTRARILDTFAAMHPTANTDVWWGNFLEW